MIKAIELAHKIRKELDKNWLPELEELNLHDTFNGIYQRNVTVSDLSKSNACVAYIIYAYDPDSTWLDIKKDRFENKEKILTALGIKKSTQLFQDIVNNSNDKLNDAIVLYLGDLTNWRWPTIFSQLDYHSKMLRFANQRTEEEKRTESLDKEGDKQTLAEDYKIDIIAKVNLQKGDALQKAIAARREADVLLDEIRKEFVNTDHATQSDLGFIFTDTAKKKVDILSWRSYIKERNEKKSIS